MNHRFHSICPYFAMFPIGFVEKHLTSSNYDGVVFDPFCGRGTTVFQALLQDRDAAGCDLNPVAACISAAKCDPPSLADVRRRLEDLRIGIRQPDDGDWFGDLDQFFDFCFHPDTLLEIRYLRSKLQWQHKREDRFIAAMSLGALHGDSHRSPNYFSNRMPRTISTKPKYSVNWWQKKGHRPPRRDVFDILRRVLDFRFKSQPPNRIGTVIQADARNASESFPNLTGRVTDVITSPPYLDTTNYREDQWLRLWFLGGDAIATHKRGDDRYCNKDMYWSFLKESIRGLAPLLANQVKLVIRIGGRRFEKAELREGLVHTLTASLNHEVQLVDDGHTSNIEKTQANAFRTMSFSRGVEHDFCFCLAT